MPSIGDFFLGVAVGGLLAAVGLHRLTTVGKPHFNPDLVSKEPSLFLVNDEVIKLGNGKRLTVDDILLAENVLFDEANLFKTVRWKGMNILQTPNDMMAIHTFLWEEQPDMLIELGSNTGGSAVFYAETMTSYNPNAHVITIDPRDGIAADLEYGIPVEVPASSSPLWGSHVHHIVGYPTSKEVRFKVEALLEKFNSSRIALFEDSDHAYETVMENLAMYQRYIKFCGWIMVHDIKAARLYNLTGPLAATRDFVKRFPLFRVNRRYEFLLSTEMPQGWMQKFNPFQPCGDGACNYGSSVRDQLCQSEGTREPKVWLYAPPS